MEEKIKDWFLIACRVPVAVILAIAGSMKFVSYSDEVAGFVSYGIPMPELMVPIVGAIQVIAAVLIGLGIAGRIGSVLIVPIMLTAMATAGLEFTNILVFVGCVGILVLGTGRYSLKTEEELLGTLSPR